MRRCDIVTRILLIISIIDFKFALAAPISVQEKRQGLVDVAHIVPKDVITVLGKRGDEELEDLWEEYFNTLENLEEESSSSLSEPDHGSTNDVQAPARPISPSSTANPDPLMEPSSSYKGDDESHWPQYTPTSSGYNSDREFMEAHAVPPNHPMPSTDSDSDSSTDPPDVDWGYWMNSEDLPPPRPPSPKDFGQAHES
jgi:hypothetical protein